MELLLKCAALAVFSAAAGLLIRRFHPELSFALGAASAAVVLLACGTLLQGALDLLDEPRRILGGSAAELRPVLKCLGIAFVSRLGADLCRDASQTALAASLELAGSLCAAAVAAPMILSVLTMIGGML